MTKPTQAQIEACPFCGGPASIEEHPSGLLSGVLFSVGCDSDSEANCMGYQSLTMFNTRHEAIEAWNKRASAALTAAAQVGEPELSQSDRQEVGKVLRAIIDERLATIERCAQVADNMPGCGYPQIAAAIRKLKNEP